MKLVKMICNELEQGVIATTNLGEEGGLAALQIQALGRIMHSMHAGCAQRARKTHLDFEPSARPRIELLLNRLLHIWDGKRQALLSDLRPQVHGGGPRVKH